MMHRFWIGGLLALVLAASPAARAAIAPCDAMVDPVLVRVDPVRDINLLTISAHEAGAAAADGFSQDRGTPVRASRRYRTGLVGVHRLVHGTTGNMLWTHNAGEIANAVTNLGYVDYGVGFSALATAADCTVPVHRYKRGSRHRHAFSAADRSALEAAGWTLETVSFHAVPVAQADTVFSFAVIPDTQNEVFGNGARHIGRAQWLADNRGLLDLRFVLHSGDITNWGERDPPQYEIAVAGVVPLQQAGIPFAYTPGNHDTRAVGCPPNYGGACPGESASVNVRLLPLFSQYFNDRFTVSGRMEPGKVDNYYTLFEAGGVSWLVLSLELWPRTTVVDWAKTVVAAHPQHNVILVTHMHLNGDGTISTSNGGYGANSPKYVYDNLISQYANFRFVFSGHVGAAASRIDTGVHGNRIASFLQAFHSPSNPVRIVEIDTAAGEASTWIYAPQTQQSWPEYEVVVDGLGFIGAGDVPVARPPLRLEDRAPAPPGRAGRAAVQRR